MSASWVAGSVRARALARRRIGAGAARSFAASESLAAALTALAGTPYRHAVRAGQSLAEAQHSIAATLLWHHRVLAGWLPPAGTELLRVISGGFEIANVDELLDQRDGRAAEPYFQLGALATAWPRLAPASGSGQLRSLLATSAWGDPGEDTATAVRHFLRLRWAARVAATSAEALPWAAAAAALQVARQRFLSGSDLSGAAKQQARSLIGGGAVDAASPHAFVAVLPATARWVFDEAEDPADLWQAEMRWWARVEHDGFALLARSGFSAQPVLGAVAVLAVDAWRARAALELAARGGRSLEAFDDLA